MLPGSAPPPAAARTRRRAMNAFIREVTAAVTRLERDVREPSNRETGETGGATPSGAWG